MCAMKSGCLLRVWGRLTSHTWRSTVCLLVPVAAVLLLATSVASAASTQSTGPQRHPSIYGGLTPYAATGYFYVTQKAAAVGRW